MPSDSNVIGWVVVGLSALVGLLGGAVGVAVGIKSLFFDKSNNPDPDREYVTRGELTAKVDEVEREISLFKSEINTKIDVLKIDIMARVDKMEGYTRAGIHDLRNVMNTLMLRVERLLVLREAGALVKKADVIEPPLSPPNAD
jgi:hypothetical protein